MLLGGCGGGGGADPPSTSGPDLQARGTLRIAVGGGIESLDPLLARTRPERLAARQVYEPLVSRQNGPFGQTRRRAGLLRSIKPSAGSTIWTAELRPGVRFGNGEALDADAIKANVNRWLRVDPGPKLLPDLDAVDSPRPGLVRFLLDRPAPRFPSELANAALGVVAPDALRGGGPGAVRSESTGTGPFELREHDPERTLLARNADWWGKRLGLGPGVDQIELLDLGGPRRRVAALADGAVEVADGLDPKVAPLIERDPLLSVVRGRGSIIGVERSVRGIDSGEADQSLSDVWLTDLR